MEEWGTIITTITTILPFPLTKGRKNEDESVQPVEVDPDAVKVTLADLRAEVGA